MLRVEDGLIVENNAYLNGQQMAEQIGVMPPLDSAPRPGDGRRLQREDRAASTIRKLRNR